MNHSLANQYTIAINIRYSGKTIRNNWSTVIICVTFKDEAACTLFIYPDYKIL